MAIHRPARQSLRHPHGHTTSMPSPRKRATNARTRALCSSLSWLSLTKTLPASFSTNPPSGTHRALKCPGRRPNPAPTPAFLANSNCWPRTNLSLKCHQGEKKTMDHTETSPLWPADSPGPGAHRPASAHRYPARQQQRIQQDMVLNLVTALLSLARTADGPRRPRADPHLRLRRYHVPRDRGSLPEPLHAGHLQSIRNSTYTKSAVSQERVPCRTRTALSRQSAPGRSFPIPRSRKIRRSVDEMMRKLSVTSSQ